MWSLYACVMRHTHLAAVLEDRFRSITFEDSFTFTKFCDTWHRTQTCIRPTAFLPLCQTRYLHTAPSVLSAESLVKSRKSGTMFKSDHPRIPPLTDSSLPTARTHICKVPTEPTHINALLASGNDLNTVLIKTQNHSMHAFLLPICWHCLHTDHQTNNGQDTLVADQCAPVKFCCIQSPCLYRVLLLPSHS